MLAPSDISWFLDVLDAIQSSKRHVLVTLSRNLFLFCDWSSTARATLLLRLESSLEFRGGEGAIQRGTVPLRYFHTFLSQMAHTRATAPHSFLL